VKSKQLSRFVILGRKKIFGKGHKVEVSTWVRDEHATAARGQSCAYKDPPGVLYIQGTGSRG